MATQNARQDENQFQTTTYVAGTSGTAAVGTEDGVQGRADSSTGAQYVYNLGPAGTTAQVLTGGTLNVLEAGTFTAEQTVAPAVNTYGTSGTLVSEAVGTIVNYTAGTAFKLRGFLATGSGQGYFTLEIGVGTITYFYRTNIADKVAQVVLPNPMTIPSSTAVILKVQNENGDSQTFEGQILGE